MSWRTIYITESERLGVYLDSLLVIKNGDEYKIPLSDIGSIIIEDTRTTVTIKLMNKILEYGILLVVCDDKHNPSGIFNSMVGHIRQAKIVRQQLEWKLITIKSRQTSISISSKDSKTTTGMETDRER